MSSSTNCYFSCLTQTEPSELYRFKLAFCSPMLQASAPFC